MTKSVLVIETPPHCMDCPIATMIKDKARDKYEAYCTPCGKLNKQTMEKPEWCPLKPMPLMEVDQVDTERDEWMDGYECGWNACIDELEERNESI